jgi:hypothetical protein
LVEEESRSWLISTQHRDLVTSGNDGALVIGVVELFQVTFGLGVLGLGKLGYLVVGLFLATWAISLVYWKIRRVEERWTV